MDIRPLYVAIFCLSLISRSCLSAEIFSQKGRLAEEESDVVEIEAIEKGKVSTSIVQPTYTLAEEESNNEVETDTIEKGKVDISIVQPPYKPSSHDNKSDDSSSSEESSSHEKDKNKSSETSEESSSEEKSHKKRYKRSLDSNQDVLNTISSNVTIKENELQKDKTPMLENSKPSESTIGDEYKDSSPLESSTVADSLTTRLGTEPTILEGEETTTEEEKETTTSSAIESTRPTEATTQAEGESESDIPPATTTESNIVSTTETSQETSSSEENVDSTSQKASTTPSTEVEPSNSKESQEDDLMGMAIARVNKLSDQIRLVLAQYRKSGVVVIPGQSFFPDPMPMQDFRKKFSVGVMDFKNMRIYGLSNFTVEHINTDVDRMQVYILLHMKKLVILGDYSLRSFFSRAAGPFNVTLLEVDSEGVAEVETAPEGHLEATDSVMDMFTQEMKMNFKNMGYMESMVSTVGEALFNSIKPQILERVNIIIRKDVNTKLKEFSTKFINKVNPVDLAFSEGRKYAKSHGYDPYHIKDHTFIVGGLVYVNITEFWVEGLSRFFRVGNLSLSMDSGVIEIGIHVMTKQLTGHCVWAGQTFGIVKSGRTNFTIDHLQVRALVNQSLDITKKPQLHDLDLELGWVKVTMDSPMTLNLMIEGIINAFPRLIRHIIVDAIEQPLKEKIQEILDQINVESIVEDNLPRLDDFGL